MCGLVGYIRTNKNVTEDALDKWFEMALFVDTIRGKDSTGIFVGHESLFNQGWGPEIHKDAVTAEQLLQKKLVRDNFDKYIGKRFVAGHNRAATMGKVIAENAHPFQHGNITLAHNGTLDWTAELKGNSAVDSELICETMSVDGGNTKVLEKLEGAYALTWHDMEDNSFNIARNKERPLHIAFNSTGSCLVYASEKWMIEELASKAKLYVGTVTMLPVGEHWKFKLDDSVDLRKYSVEKFTPLPSWNDKWANNYRYNTYLPAKNKEIEKINTTVQRNAERVMGDLGLAVGDLVAFTTVDVKQSLLDEHAGKYNYEGLALNLNIVDKAKEDVVIKAFAQEDTSPMDEILVGFVKTAYDSKHMGPVLILDGVMEPATYAASAGISLNEVYDYIYTLTVDTEDDGDYSDFGVKDFSNLWEDEEEEEALYEGPNGKKLTLGEFHAATGGYCAQCGGNIFLQDHQDIEWVNNGQGALCPDCAVKHANEASN